MKLTEYRITVDEDLLRRFEATAFAQQRTGEQVLRDLMLAFIGRPNDDYDAWFIRQVQIGIDAANAGQLVSNEEVEAEFAARRAETQK